MTDASYFFPGQLFQNPDGTFNLNITGHIHAAGVDLDASTILTPPNADKVRWIRASDGAVIADISGLSVPGTGNELLLDVRSIAAADLAAMQLDALDDQGTSRAQIRIGQRNRGASAFATITAGILARTLLDQGGNSGYAQLAQVSPSVIWSGAIAGASGGVRLNGTGNWTCTRTAVGVYTLTMNSGVVGTALNGVWAIPIIQCNDSQGAVAEVDYVSQIGATTTVTVKTFSGPFGFAAADTNWSFEAIATAN